MRRFVIGLTALLLFGAGVSVSLASGEPQYGGVLTVGLEADFVNLDPTRSNQAIDRHIVHLLFDTLVRADREQVIMPGLAESWDISDDQLEYTFYLRQGVTFHDGTPFNAEAMKFSLDRARLEGLRGRDVSSIDRVEVVDEYTMRVILSEPQVSLLGILSDQVGSALSPTAVAALGEDFGRSPVGTGAFRFVEWVADDRLVLERNDDYWEEGLPYLDQVILRPRVDPTVRMLEFRGGQLDVAERVPPREVEAVNRDPNLQALDAASTMWLFIHLNTDREPFGSLEVRQALAHSLDRDLFVRVVYSDMAYPAASWIPPGHWAYDPTFEGTTYDPELSRQLLSEAGYEDGFRFELLIPDIAEWIQLAEMWQVELATMNIVVDIVVMDFGSVLEREKSREFHAMVMDATGRVPDPDPQAWSLLATGGYVPSGFTDPIVDELFAATRAVPDQDVRRDAYAPLIRRVSENANMLFVVHESWIHGVGADVRDYVVFPDGRFRFQRVWLDR